MVLQLKQLFEIPGQSLSVDEALPVSELADSPLYEAFAAPVSIKGRIINRAGAVTLEYTVTAVLHCVCDRCLKAFDREYAYTFSHKLARSLAGGDDTDYVLCPDNTLDMTELTSADLILELPTKILCKEDCAGLCPRCGADLNDGACGCNQ